MRGPPSSLLLVGVAALVGVAGAASCEPVKTDGPDAGFEDAFVPCEDFFGDEAQEAQVQLVYRTVDGGVAVMDENTEIPLLLPPQGGKVLLIGVRARNLDLCALGISTAIHDECTALDGGFGRIVGREGRPLRLVPSDDGWAYPDRPDTLTNFSNVPACPNSAFSRDIDGEPYLVRARLLDRSSLPQRDYIAEAHIIPVCAEPEHLGECTCQCDADFILGQECAELPDGGAGDDGDIGDPAPGACLVGWIAPDAGS